MHPGTPDRRANPRSPIEFPVVISGGDIGPEAKGTTRDVSRDGIYFFTDSALAIGQVLEFKMPMPEQGGTSVRSLCSGTVIRIEKANRAVLQAHGVAVHITNIQLV